MLIFIIVSIFCVVFFRKSLYITSEQAFINTKLITLRSPIEGSLKIANVAVGSFVDMEQSVFEVFNPLFGNSSSNSQCDFHKAKIDQLENEIAENTLNADLLETDLKRHEELKSIGAVSVQDFEKIDSSLKVLKVMMVNKKTQLVYLRKRLQETEEQVDLLKKSIVATPVKGVIWTIFKKDGEHVEVNDEVLQMIDPRSIWVDAFFSERYSEKLKPGEQVIVSPLGSNESWTGTIVFLRGGCGRVTYDSAVEIPPKAISRRLISARIEVDWNGRFGVNEFYGIGRSIRVRSVREKFRNPMKQFSGMFNAR